MRVKFESGVSFWLKLLIVVFNIITLLLFSAKIFIDSYITVKLGIAFLVVDAVVIVPLILLTYYKFEDDCLLIHDFPIRQFRIKYTDIVDVEDGDFETKEKKSIVALSLDRIVLVTEHEDSEGKKHKRYIYISPKDMSLFLIRLSARLEQNKVDIEQKAKEISLKQKEHELKKKLAEEKRKKEKEQNAPEIIRMKSSPKAEGFKEKKTDDGEEKSPDDGE
ncbi:MAG: PH domain-containing protein [Clostridia bacterium]|nr:PH domain-containing protein [Clostridia bacterium]